jgi:hypothetical protein
VYHRVVFFILFLTSCHIEQVSAQYDSLWACGQFSSIMDFRNKDTVLSPSRSLSDKYLYTILSLSTLYYPNHDLLFLSNGVDITNSKRQDVENDNLLIDPIFKQRYSAGISSINSTLLLPRDSISFYSINRSGDGSYIDPFNTLIGNRTYYGVIAMRDSFKSKVVQSKVSLRYETILPTSSFLTATRHANGRDFWIVEKAWKGNTYYVYRTSPDTIVLAHTQTIGDSTGEWDIYGGGVFSPQGDRLVFTCATQYVQLFDFDRCTGLFSNPLKLLTPAFDRLGDSVYSSLDTPFGGLYASFSPSGRFLYYNTLWRIEQYDLASGIHDSIIASRYMVDKWDSSFLTIYQTYEPFGSSLLAVNNKLYFSLFNPLNIARLHIINSPDSAGVKCNYVRCGMKLGVDRVSGDPLPNVPYYSLKVQADSPCDTIGKVAPPKPIPLAFSLYPNPSRGHFSTASPAVGELYLYDAMGRLVKRIEIIAGTQQHSIDLPAGVYVASVKFGERRETLRVVVW